MAQDTLFNLLPAIYRIRDAEVASLDALSGGIGPLQALLRVMSQPLDAMADNLEQLYDDAFIETCADWVVPYIGDLIGTRSLQGGAGSARSSRAEVAHTIGLRRRKGTIAVLQTLARDVTGWDSRAVEFFQHLATTQYMNHIRPAHRVTPSLREWEPLERIGTAFDSIPRSVDVRRIETGRGRYNIPNVGIFLWPLSARPLRRSPAERVDDRRYLFSPLGHDMQLFTMPAPSGDRHGPEHVPAPLSRRVVAENTALYYGPHDKSINLNVDGVDIDGANILIANLGDVGSGWAHLPPAGSYAIDPVLGRVALPPNPASGTTVLVNFADAFGADMGGGEYERADSFDRTDRGATLLRVPEDRATIQDAIDSLPQGGIVQISNSGRYEGPLTIGVPARSHIELRAASGARPSIVLTREMEVSGGTDSRLSLNGLLISGKGIAVASTPVNELRTLTLTHCTLVPGLRLTRQGRPAEPSQPSLIVSKPDVRVELRRTISGALRIDRGSSCFIVDSIVDATDAASAACEAPAGGSGGPLEVRESTIVGRVATRALTLASNAIFTSPVIADDRQQGCVRFSYLPLASRAPRRHRCQPANDGPAAVLQFVTSQYGSPSYLRLDVQTSVAVRRGADDQGEMGAYHHVHGPQREANLRLRLDEYLRAGLEAGVFHERREEV